MQFFRILQMVVSLLPVLSQLIKSIDELFPQKDQGPKKLEMVRKMLESTYKAAGDTSVAFEQVWPVISTTVGAAVELKKTGDGQVSDAG